MCCDTTDKWRRCLDLYSPISVLCVWRWIEKRLIVIFCLLFVVGPVVIDLHIPQSLCCPVCSAEPGNWSELQLHLAEHLSSVFNGFRNASMGETQVGTGFAKSGSASGETGGGRRGQRVRGSATLGGRAGFSVTGQRGRTERPDLHGVQDIPGPKLGKTWPKQWQRQVGSTTTPLAQSRTSPKQSARTLKSSSVPRTCTCG